MSRRWTEIMWPASSSASTRDKYSGVMDSREAMVALLTGSDTSEPPSSPGLRSRSR